MKNCKNLAMPKAVFCGHLLHGAATSCVVCNCNTLCTSEINNFFQM